MSSKNEIENKILDAFLVVLKTTPFEKVKVTNVIKIACISHQTFYRYYVDKYDWALKTTVSKFSAFSHIYGSNATWKEIVISIIHSIKTSPLIFKRLLSCPEGFEIITKSLLIVSKKYTGHSAYEPGIYGWVCVFRQWSAGGFTASVDEIYSQIRKSVPIQDVLYNEDFEKAMSVYENRRLNFFAELGNK